MTTEHLMPVQPGWYVELGDHTVKPLVAWIKDREGIWPAVWITGQGLTMVTDAFDLRATEVVQPTVRRSYLHPA